MDPQTIRSLRTRMITKQILRSEQIWSGSLNRLPMAKIYLQVTSPWSWEAQIPQVSTTLREPHTRTTWTSLQSSGGKISFSQFKTRWGTQTITKLRTTPPATSPSTTKPWEQSATLTTSTCSTSSTRRLLGRTLRRRSSMFPLFMSSAPTQTTSSSLSMIFGGKSKSSYFTMELQATKIRAAKTRLTSSTLPKSKMAQQSKRLSGAAALWCTATQSQTTARKSLGKSPISKSMFATLSIML